MERAWRAPGAAVAAIAAFVLVLLVGCASRERPTPGNAPRLRLSIASDPTAEDEVPFAFQDEVPFAFQDVDGSGYYDGITFIPDVSVPPLVLDADGAVLDRVVPRYVCEEGIQPSPGCGQSAWFRLTTHSPFGDEFSHRWSVCFWWRGRLSDLSTLQPGHCVLMAHCDGFLGRHGFHVDRFDGVRVEQTTLGRWVVRLSFHINAEDADDFQTGTGECVLSISSECLEG